MGLFPFFRRHTLNVDRLVQTATTALIAVGLGVALYEALQTHTSPIFDDEPEIPDLSKMGRELLAKKHAGEAREEFLKQKYTGLFLIGRAGDGIRDDELDALCAELGHFHQQCYAETHHDADRSLVEWYSLRGVSLKTGLAPRLGACPTVGKNFDAHRYIASAITNKKKLPCHTTLMRRNGRISNVTSIYKKAVHHRTTLKNKSPAQHKRGAFLLVRDTIYRSNNTYE